jgi:murein DD-endopeptidase MepM/ murein hydrolase activator NlpD
LREQALAAQAHVPETVSEPVSTESVTPAEPEPVVVAAPAPVVRTVEEIVTEYAREASAQLPDSAPESEPISEPVGNFVVPMAQPVISPEPVEESQPEEIEVQSAVEAKVPVASPAVAPHSPAAEQAARTHKLVKRVTPRRPAFLSNRSQRDRNAADRRRQISQRVFSVLALLACFAFALSISIPANALLTQSDVAKIKMQAFLDEQVSLASQSVDVDSESTTASAARDGVDVTLAAKAAPIKFYGNSGLCGEETSVNPPSSSGAITWPLQNRKVSSGYGYRWGSLHAGIDFEGDTGTPIYAVADGIVKAAQPSANNSLGICAIISHNVNGVQFDTLYGHMSRMDIGVGQAVSAGQVIGAVGSTGNSTGSHLHFEVHVNNVQIDPGPFMSNYAG